MKSIPILILPNAFLLLAISLAAFSVCAAGEGIVCITIRAPLDESIVPYVEFEEAPMQKAIDFVAAKSIELDTRETDPAKKGIQIRWFRSEEDAGKEEPEINFQYENVPLRTILLEMAMQAHCDLHTTSIGVVFTPAGKPPFPHAEHPGAKILETLYRYQDE